MTQLDLSSRILGEIATDVKHILLRQDKQDKRIDRITDRLDKVEAFQYKIIGITLVVPTALTTFGLYLRLI